MKKILLALAVIIGISLIVYLVYVFYPKEVDLNAQGIKYQLGNQSDALEQPVTIHIMGKMYRSFSGNRTFKGTVDIEGEELPVPENQREIVINFYKGRNGVLAYPYNKDAMPYIYMVGQIYINRDFSRAAIAVLDKQQGDQGQWSGENGLMIAVPAANRSDALNISNELMNKYLDGYNLE
ncbi:hypothetical protein [Paenibacillus sp. YIM B09110]|uniref:hypothetical protein n=1 Tax=Paenibacillus sp. YIM B09110 TaxID=3126102 RepID=UPI00301C9641